MPSWSSSFCRFYRCHLVSDDMPDNMLSENVVQHDHISKQIYGMSRDFSQKWHFEAKWPKMCHLANFSNFWKTFLDVVSSQKRMSSEMSCCLDIVGKMLSEMLSSRHCWRHVVKNVELWCYRPHCCQNLMLSCLELPKSMSCIPAPDQDWT